MTDCKTNCERFDRMLYALPERISLVLSALPVALKASAYEIRIRVNKPVCITGDTVFYISSDSVACTYIPKSPLVASEEEIKDILLRITDRSVYTRTAELSKGYLSMRYGGRAGVCGRFVEGKFCDTTSVNIRIPRQIIGSAEPILSAARKGILIAGPPGSGKTTLLRDLVRLLSVSGKRVCVIDSRGEICGRQQEEDALDIGPNTDVITGVNKAKGTEIALRTMFPDFIAFDEVGTGEELALIKESFFSGVSIITTAHAADTRDLISRPVTKLMLEGFMGSVALLSKKPGGPIRILKAEEVRRFA